MPASYVGPGSCLVEVVGGEEGDYFQPGNGADNTFGDSGNDTVKMNADDAADYVDCGDGDDTVNATDLDPTDSFFGCENINVS